MNRKKAISDQLYKWSDKDENQIDYCHPTKAKSAFEKLASPRCHFARISHRALQEVRQSGMQVRKLKGPWSQILFIRQQTREKSTDGLRSTDVSRKSQGIFRKLPKDQGDPGRTLRNQLRTFEAPRKTLARAPPRPL